jgi:hypothetical protein
MKTGIFLSATLLALPLTGFAATYDYIDADGTVQTVSANDASEALAQADDKDMHSGVMLHDGLLDAGDTVFGIGGSGDASVASSGYQYVDTNGVVQEVSATNAAEAFQMATNIDEHSGVQPDTGLLDEGDTVEGT